MMNATRWRATAAAAAVSIAGGCQLVSGLSGLHPGEGGTGGSSSGTGAGSTASASSAGGAAACSSGTGGATSSSGSGGTGGAGGGPCPGGPCAPVMVVSHLDPMGNLDWTVNGLAVSPTSLYWSVLPSMAAGYIANHPLSSSDPALATPYQTGIFPTRLLVDGPSLYWVDVGSGSLAGLYRTLEGPMPGAMTFLFPDAPPPEFYVVGTQIAWIVPSQNRLVQGLISADHNVPAATNFNPAPALTAKRFAFDSTLVFWADDTSLRASTTPPTNAGAVSLAGVKTPEVIVNMVADAVPGTGNLYVIAENGTTGGTVRRVPKNSPSGFVLTGSQFTELRATVGFTGDLRIDPDGSHLYWVEYASAGCTGAAEIHRAALPDGPAELMFSGPAPKGCILLALDAKNLYWVDGTAIYSLPK